MVGYNPELERQLTKTDHAIAGAFSGSVSRALFQPLDVLKIRFQLQVEPVSRTAKMSKYTGIPQAVQQIIKEEGWKALWKGHVPAQGLSILYGIVQFTAFECLTKIAWQKLPEEFSYHLRPVSHTFCGSLAAAAATLVVQPLDVLRTRFIAQGEPKSLWISFNTSLCDFMVATDQEFKDKANLDLSVEKTGPLPKIMSMYRSLLHGTSTIVRQEGFLALYKGLVPTLFGVVPQMGLQFGFYTLFTGIWKNSFGQKDPAFAGPFESLICGSGSGVVTKCLIYPLDVAKKRLQVQGFEKARKSFGETRRYHGMVHCLFKVFKEEGLRGIYKGLYPSLLKAAAVSGCNMCVYDQICRLIVWSRKL